MVDCEYSTTIDLNISNGTGMENPEMLKFVPGQLKKCVRIQLQNYLIY